MASRIIPKFFRIGEMIYNPRYIKTIHITPEKVAIKIRNTEYSNTWNDDVIHEYYHTKQPSQYSDVLKMVAKCSDY